MCTRASCHARPSTRLRRPAVALLATGLLVAPPVIADEIGANDFRISNTINDAADRTAASPALAYAPDQDLYLAVWSADGEQWPGEYFIYGQRLDGQTGAEIGAQFQISGPPALGSLSDATVPDVAYNPKEGEFLVVWRTDLLNDFPPTPANYEIVGRRVRASNGALLGSEARYSSTGVPGFGSDFKADKPAIVYNPDDHEYYLVWHANGGIIPEPDSGNEIYGLRIDAPTGSPLGLQVQLSETGSSIHSHRDAVAPAVAYGSAHGEYQVAWAGEEEELLDGQSDIFGQRVDASNGHPVGEHDFRIGATYSSSLWLSPEKYDGTHASVAYSEHTGDFLVVYTSALEENYHQPLQITKEVHGQFIAGGADEKIGGKFRISHMGGDTGTQGAVRYDSLHDEFLVVWSGDDASAAMVDDEFEIFGQRIDARTGDPVGEAEFRLSDAGDDGVDAIDARWPALAFQSNTYEFLVVWSANDDANGLSQDKTEIYGQRWRLYPTEVQATETVRLGEPANPDVLLGGQTYGPVIGKTWDPIVDHTSFMPDAVLDVLGIGTVPTNVPSGWGTLLNLESLVLLTAAPGQSFESPTPEDPALIGVSLVTQAASLSATEVRLTNALDLVLGTY